jgi:hypothetical protein
MNTLEFIKTKIADLGGIEKNPLCPEDGNGEDLIFLHELEKKVDNKLPDLYVTTIRHFGAFSFQKLIKVKCQDLNPAADNDNKVVVDYFYSLKDQGECSLKKILSIYSDQIPNYLLPICDGESGDLICIDCRPSSYGSIVYWFHEGNEGEDLFTIAKSFAEFISMLEVAEEVDKNEDLSNIQVKASDKLLEMLKKSGYGPKK